MLTRTASCDPPMSAFRRDSFVDLMLRIIRGKRSFEIELYAPVKIAVAYAGQNPVPKPFLMILVWIMTPNGWKRATDIALPVPPAPQDNRK